MAHLNHIWHDMKNTCSVSIHRWSWDNAGICGLEIYPISLDTMRECEEGRRGTESLWKQKQGQRMQQREKSEAAHRWWAVSGRLCICVCVPKCVCVPCSYHAYLCTVHVCGVHVCPCLLVLIHACVSVPSVLRRGTACAHSCSSQMALANRHCKGWQSWHSYPVHSWHCQPPCSPRCTGARVPAASHLSSLTDWQAVYPQTSVGKVSLFLLILRERPFNLKENQTSCFQEFIV